MHQCKRTHLFRSEYVRVFSKGFHSRKIKGTGSRDPQEWKRWEYKIRSTWEINVPQEAVSVVFYLVADNLF